jgi:hypothetical protein
MTSAALSADATTARPSASPRAAVLDNAVVIGVAALLAAGCCWPIFTHAIIPLVDLPAHASQVALWRAWGNDPDLHQRYTLHFDSPCAAFYILWRALTAIGLSIDAAGKVMIAICLLAVPLGLAVLLRSRGRPREWALLAFPLVFTQQLAWGFLPFYFAFALLFFSLAAFSGWLRLGGWPRALLVIASGLLLLWTHALTAGFWGLACGLLALAERIPLRRRAMALVPLLVPGAVLAIWALREAGHGTNVHYGGTFSQRAGTFFQMISDGTTPEVTQTALLTRWVVLGVLVLAVLQAVMPNRRQAEPVIRPLLDVDVPLLLAAAAALGLYLTMPLMLFQSDLVCVRFAPMAWLLFIAALPRLDLQPARLAILAAAAVVALEVDVGMSRAWGEFNRTVGDARSLFALLPPKASVDRPDGAARSVQPLQLRVFDNFALWGQVHTLGAARSFTRFPQMLVQDAQSEPDPLFDATMAKYQDGRPAIVSASGRAPDALVFYSEESLPAALPLAGRHATYRLLGRTGGLNAYLLQRAAP